MNYTKYRVYLTGYNAPIHAFSEREAIILVQAEAIREGKNYEFVSIETLLSNW